MSIAPERVKGRIFSKPGINVKILVLVRKLNEAVMECDNGNADVLFLPNDSLTNSLHK